MKQLKPLWKQGLQRSLAIKIGGDPIMELLQKKQLSYLMNDPKTELIIMIGEIGGQLEADAAKWIKQQ